MNKILFNPSSLHSIMTNAKGKSNLEKYDEAFDKNSELLEEFESLKNKETKKAEAIQKRISKNVDIMRELYSLKNLPLLSETTKTYLREKMIEIRYGRRKEIESKYTLKGKECEEAGITLYSLLKRGIVFENNKERLQNEYITGEIDLAWRNKAKEIYAITDIKNSYSIFTFFENEDKIKPANKWQGVGYMMLHPKCETYYIANVLINNTPDAILTILQRESYKWKDGDTPNWRELELIKEHIFTEDAFIEFAHNRGCTPICEKSKQIYNSFVELPKEVRLIEHSFKRNEEDILAVQKRIDECRIYLEMIYGLK